MEDSGKLPGATCKGSLQVHALPEYVEAALGVVALSDFPSVESVLRHHISDLTRRLAEAEQSEHDFRNEAQEVYTDQYIQRKRAEAAERELEELKRSTK